MRTSLGNPRAGALLFGEPAAAGRLSAGMLRVSWGMFPRAARKLSIAWLWVATVAMVVAAPHAAIPLRLPFDILPGAAYLALLGAPMLFRGAEGSEPGHDIQLGAYLGPAYTPPSDMRLLQPGGTDLKLEDIPWLGEPFKAPPYYGYRAIYWLPSGKVGFMGDFTHIKAIADRKKSIRQSGFRDGKRVAAEESLETTFRRLEFTHGYNIITFNVLRRGTPRGPWLIPYAGAGFGLAYPHVEMQRTGAPKQSRTFEYQIAGPAAQVLAGIEWRIGRRISVFLEYKLSCGAINGDLLGGGALTTRLCTHQFLAGPAIHLKARSDIGPAAKPEP